MGWIPNYSSRKRFEVLGSTDGLLFDHVIPIVVHRSSGTDSGNHIYLGTSIQSDYDDIRFTIADGSTKCQQYLVSYDAASATYYVKLPRVRINPYQTKFYVYYNNAAETLSSVVLATSSATDAPRIIGWNAVEDRYPKFSRGAIDRPLFRIESRDRDFSHLLVGGSIENATNEIGQANITLFNKHNVLIDGLLEEDDPLVIHMSRNGGDSWTTRFTGSIITKNIKQGPDGSTVDITAVGTPAVRHFLCSPNQLEINRRELGSVFTGTEDDANDVSWNPDANGNYPNGLLYKTGYSYSADAITNLYTGSTSYTTSVDSGGDEITITTSINNWDIPSRMVFNNSNLFDALSEIQNALALNFCFDDNTMEFRCYQDPNISDFPTASVTLDDGLDMLSFNYGTDASQWYDRVTVIGSSYGKYYSYGTGGHEYVLRDDNLRTHQACKEKAMKIWEVHNTGRTTFQAECSPIDTNILGYKISLSSTRHSISDYGNVVSQKDDFSPGQWKTTIALENIPTLIPKTLKEIKDEIRSASENHDHPRIYLNCVGHPASISNYNVCAIGIGSGGSSSIALSSIVQTQPTFADGQHLISYAQFAGGTSQRVNELVIFGNRKTASDSQLKADYAPYNHSKTFSVALDTVITVSDTEYIRLCSINELSNSYLVNMNNINTNDSLEQMWCSVLPKSAAAVRLVVNTNISESWVPWHPTSSNWGTIASGSSEVSSSALFNLSTPNGKGTGFSHGSTNPPNGACLYVKMDVGFRGVDSATMDSMFSGIDDAIFVIRTGNKYPGDSIVTPMYWNFSNSAWVTISSFTNSAYKHTESMNPREWVDGNGTMYIAIRNYVPTTGTYTPQYYFSIDYLAGSIRYHPEPLAWNTIGPKILYEKVKWDPARKRFMFHDISGSVKVSHIYLYGSVSADGEVVPDVNSADLASIKNFIGYEGAFGNGIQDDFAFLNGRYVKHNAGLFGDPHWYSLSYADRNDPTNPAKGAGVIDVVDVLDRVGGAYFVYEIIPENVVEQLPSLYNKLSLDKLYVKRTSVDFSTSDLYMMMSSDVPTPNSELSISFNCVNGAPIAKFVVDTASRIDQGVCFPNNANIYVCTDLDFASTTAGPGKIKGLGVELGRPL